LNITAELPQKSFFHHGTACADVASNNRIINNSVTRDFMTVRSPQNLIALLGNQQATPLIDEPHWQSGVSYHKYYSINLSAGICCAKNVPRDIGPMAEQT
jgi:hypothetical protein